MIKIFSKKSFAILLAVMLVLQVFVPATAAVTPGDYCSVCGDNADRGALKHTIAPTCGEDGFEIYDCEYVDGEVNCAGNITVRIPATGVHVGDGTVVPEVPATCTTEGTVSYEKCKDCGTKLEPGTSNELGTIVIPALGHDYVGTPTPADCENDGYTTYVCSRCNDTYEGDKVDALGHIYVDKDGLNPTCHTEGYTAYKECSVCNKIDPENPKVERPIVNHNGKYIDAEYVAETCTANGTKVFGCEEPTCPYYYDGGTYKGVTEVIDEIDGHDIVTVKKVDPACGVEGHEEYEYCKREGCGYTTDDASKVIPALVHTEVTVAVILPTCTEDGATTAVICDICGYVHHAAEVIPALGHTNGAVVKENEVGPTCVANGSYDDVVYCTVCEAEVSRETKPVPATGHTLTNVPALEADCVNDGNIAHSNCSVCGKNFAYDADGTDITIEAIADVVIKATGHTYKKWAAPAATCTTGGWDVFTCTSTLRDGTACKHTYSEQTEALGHDVITVDKVEATCEDAGHEAYEYCKREGCTYTTDAPEKVIDAKGHLNDVTLEAVAPTYWGINGATCDQEGLSEGKKCSACGKVTVPQNPVPLENEKVKFEYKVYSFNDAEFTVNSGRVFVDVIMNVETDFARLYAFDLSYRFNAAELDFVGATSEEFDLIDSYVVPVTPIALDEFKDVNIAPNMGTNPDGKTFAKGKHVVATLVFNVNADFIGTANLDLVSGKVARDKAFANEVEADYGTTVAILVKKLANIDDDDNDINSMDTLEMAKWIADAAEDDYNVILDLDKNGTINGDDFDLLRAAAVGDTAYLAYAK